MMDKWSQLRTELGLTILSQFHIHIHPWNILKVRKHVGGIKNLDLGYAIPSASLADPISYQEYKEVNYS